jgi:hypothetical protein
MQFVWDERETAHVTSTGVNVLSRALRISGTIRATYAPPNQASDCSGAFSVRPGGGFPMDIGSDFANDPMITVGGIAPLRGVYSQSSGSGDCGYPSNGVASTAGSVPTQNFAMALTTGITFRLSRPSSTKTIETFDVNPDGTKQITVNATFRAATDANRPPPLPSVPPLSTPGRAVAKRNALKRPYRP